VSVVIEATCAACGTLNRAPSGAKFVACSECKSRIVVAAVEPPPIPPKASGIGIADLPAPKPRAPALPIPDLPRPAPRSALDVDLPAPRGPKPAPSPLDVGDGFDDLLPPGLVDLPAPKARAAPLPTKPSAPVGLADLPAPRARTAAPEPRAVPALDDLPAPRAGAAPKLDDLPAPRSARFDDLPAPRAAAPKLDDLPAPKARVPAPPPIPATLLGPGPLADLDLPMPKPGGISDLPAPKRASGLDQELVPRSQELAPRADAGAFDLPLPSVRPDLPAPKGFFDDLPQPATLPRPSELPAPKGFFDDLPGRVSNKAPAPAELPAPKGFFDDLPGRPNTSKPEPPAPKGFFDDLPARPNTSKPEPPAPKGFFDDLPQPTRKPDAGRMPSGPMPIDLGMDPTVNDIDAPSLRKPATQPPPTSTFDDLDLSRPAPAALQQPSGRPEGMSLRTPAALPLPAEPIAQAPVNARFGPDPGLELEEPRKPNISQRLEPKRTSKLDAPRRRSKKVPAIVLGSMLVLGGGGFWFYRGWAEKQAIAAKIDDALTRARAAIVASDAAHWDRAAGAARQVLAEDSHHAEALTIGSEALLASALGGGQDLAGKVGAARNLIATATTDNLATPGLARAQALSAIAAGTPEPAIERLAAQATQDPKNPVVQLYLGWAHAAKGDHPAAITAYDQAVALGTEGIKLLALYGRGQTKLAQSDLDGARADFDAVYQQDKLHVGAQVGLAAARPIGQAQIQEDELRALLARKDLDLGDPRAVVLAWDMIAEAAKRGNRLDAARERFGKAIAIQPEDVRALSGLAEVELLDGKLDVATDLVKKALAISKDDVGAQLVQAEISIKQDNLRDAAARLELLNGRTPPPPTAQRARIALVQGRLYEAQHDDEAAMRAFEEAAKLAGDTDLVPTLSAVNKLTAVADKAAVEKNAARATELRGRADQLLAALAANAEKDPQLALTLGISYLGASDAVKAEPWLRRAVEARPNDAEAQYQLAKALGRLGRTDDALNRLQKAIATAPARYEIAIELALIYEAAGRDAEAEKTYAKLLATKDGDPPPSVEVRARAGRFYARTGDIARAAEQGAEIAKVDATNLAGMYLRAEGLLAADRLDEARALFLKAAEGERNAQYLDGLGRASERLAAKSGDTRIQDGAVRSFLDAADLDEKAFGPRAGLGRMYLARHEAAKAAAPLLAAYKLKPDAEVAFNLGLTYKLLQQTPYAIQWFQEANKLRPNAEASWNLGQMYFDANDGRQAAVALEAASRIAIELEKQSGKQVPWLTDALLKLGRVHKDLNNLRGAREAWERYVGRNPPPSVQLDEVRRALATSLKGV
jgi:tetratricopeptide (TPR) repeat protein